MNIAVLSGKGGTGKTTVSTNIAVALKANYIDCDVEEPNGFIFLKPNIKSEKKVLVEIPFIDEEKCVLCGECAKACNFHALVKLKDDIMLFPKLCHGCGACELVCEYGAISYTKREIGKILIGENYNIQCSSGILNISEAMGVPIIKELLRDKNDGLNIIDCPPGTSCNVVNSLQNVNLALIVTEPTEFGLHDMKMAIELVKLYDIPFGVIINKDDEEENLIKRYCKEMNIKLLGEIPYKREIAEEYSKGEVLYNNEAYKEIFNRISTRIKEELQWS